MSIVPKLLHSAGASEEHYNSGNYIFREDGIPQFYYQILNGDVKLNNYSRDGKEVIQNIVSDGNCFGEAMLFLNKKYPINAIALTECTIIKISREKFLNLLDEHPHTALEICAALSEKTYSRFVLMRKISSKNAVERITELLKMLKEPQENKSKYSFEIPHTRQQLASLTGLCVETAIRAIKRMEANNDLQIRNRKIFY